LFIVMVTDKEYIGGFDLSKAIISKLRTVFENTGRRISLCSIGKLEEVSDELQARHRSGEISSFVFDKYLKDFSYAPPANLPGAKSVLLVAAPIGRSILELRLEQGAFQAVIPPTYGADELIAENEAKLATMLGPAGLAYERAWLPLKTLAARMGLARYGRDNILRFEGAGSFVRLDAWWTELEAEGEHWGPAKELERCISCGACAKACPNGCFTEDRFIIDATKCLTFMNEGNAPFPTWLRTGVHNAAVGCMRCQDACPENWNVPGAVVYRSFVLDRCASESLLAGRPTAELPPTASAAVRAAEMAGCEENLARNLRALIEARGFDPSPPARA
jgi:epoxyqueuosine reductase